MRIFCDEFCVRNRFPQGAWVFSLMSVIVMVWIKDKAALGKTYVVLRLLPCR